MAKKKNGTPKLTRLIGILVELNNREWISASEIADKFSVSLRSVYRDVSELQNMGFEIIGTTGTTGGYRLARKLFFTQERDFDIYNNVKAELLVRIGRSTIESNVTDDRLISGMSLTETVYSLKDKLIFDVSDWYWKDSIDSFSTALSRAIQNQRILLLNYKERGSDENQCDRVKPYGMAWKAGSWYLICELLKSGKITRIRTNRILNITETNEKFNYPEAFDINKWWKQELLEFGRGNTEVVLKVRGNTAIQEWLKMEGKPDTVKELDNGILTVKYYVDKWNWLIPTILNYGDCVLVQKPAELRDTIIKMVKTMLCQYDNDKFYNSLQGRFENDDSRERISKSRQE